MFLWGEREADSKHLYRCFGGCFYCRASAATAAQNLRKCHRNTHAFTLKQETVHRPSVRNSTYSNLRPDWPQLGGAPTCRPRIGAHAAAYRQRRSGHGARRARPAHAQYRHRFACFQGARPTAARPRECCWCGQLCRGEPARHQQRQQWRPGRAAAAAAAAAATTAATTAGGDACTGATHAQQ